MQVRDLKAGAARLATLGGDDPLAAALQAGPPAGFAQPASRRRAAAANSDGGFGRGGRFNRSPIFNKPAANARVEFSSTACAAMDMGTGADPPRRRLLQYQCF